MELFWLTHSAGEAFLPAFLGLLEKVLSWSPHFACVISWTSRNLCSSDVLKQPLKKDVTVYARDVAAPEFAILSWQTN